MKTALERCIAVHETTDAIVDEMTAFVDIHTVWTNLSETQREMVRLKARSHIQRMLQVLDEGS